MPYRKSWNWALFPLPSSIGLDHRDRRIFLPKFELSEQSNLSGEEFFRNISSYFENIIHKGSHIRENLMVDALKYKALIIRIHTKSLVDMARTKRPNHRAAFIEAKSKNTSPGIFINPIEVSIIPLTYQFSEISPTFERSS